MHGNQFPTFRLGLLLQIVLLGALAVLLAGDLVAHLALRTEVIDTVFHWLQSLYPKR